MAALETERMLETSCGSPHYASPEIVAGKNYHGGPSDVWSCGIILFALLTGHLPFDDQNIRKLLLKVQAGKYNMPDDLSPHAKDLIQRMLQIRPESRIPISRIFDHPLLRKYPPRRQAAKMPTGNIHDVTQPCKSREDIDQEILKNLQTLWHGVDREQVIEKLLSPEVNSEKTFYCLLLKYRHDHRQDDAKQSSNSHGQQPQQLNYSHRRKSSSSVSALTKKRHSRNGSRSSVITASSSHRRSVAFQAQPKKKATRGTPTPTASPKPSQSPIVKPGTVAATTIQPEKRRQRRESQVQPESESQPQPQPRSTLRPQADMIPHQRPVAVSRPQQAQTVEASQQPYSVTRPQQPQGDMPPQAPPHKVGITARKRTPVAQATNYSDRDQQVRMSAPPISNDFDFVVDDTRPLSADFASLCEEAFNTDRKTAGRAVSDPIESLTKPEAKPDRRAFSVGERRASLLDPGKRPFSTVSTQSSVSTATTSTAATQDGYILPMIFEEDRFADAVEQEADRLSQDPKRTLRGVVPHRATIIDDHSDGDTLYKPLDFLHNSRSDQELQVESGPVESDYRYEYDHGRGDGLKEATQQPAMAISTQHNGRRNNTTASPVITNTNAAAAATYVTNNNNYKNEYAKTSHTAEDSRLKMDGIVKGADDSFDKASIAFTAYRTPPTPHGFQEAPPPVPKIQEEYLRREPLTEKDMNMHKQEKAKKPEGSKSLFKKFSLRRPSGGSDAKRSGSNGGSATVTHPTNNTLQQQAPTSTPPTPAQAPPSPALSAAPKQNWFMKMLGGGSSSSKHNSDKIETEKRIYSEMPLAHLRHSIMVTLYDWQKYGIARITEDTSTSTIRLAISSKNVLRARSSKFRIHIVTKRGISMAVFTKEKGSKQAFSRFVSEMETALQHIQMRQQSYYYQNRATTTLGYKNDPSQAYRPVQVPGF